MTTPTTSTDDQRQRQHEQEHIPPRPGLHLTLHCRPLRSALTILRTPDNRSRTDTIPRDGSDNDDVLLYDCIVVAATAAAAAANDDGIEFMIDNLRVR